MPKMPKMSSTLSSRSHSSASASSISSGSGSTPSSSASWLRNAQFSLESFGITAVPRSQLLTPTSTPTPQKAKARHFGASSLTKERRAEHKASQKGKENVPVPLRIGLPSPPGEASMPPKRASGKGKGKEKAKEDEIVLGVKKRKLIEEDIKPDPSSSSSLLTNKRRKLAPSAPAQASSPRPMTRGWAKKQVRTSAGGSSSTRPTPEPVHIDLTDDNEFADISISGTRGFATPNRTPRGASKSATSRTTATSKLAYTPPVNSTPSKYTPSAQASKSTSSATLRSTFAPTSKLTKPTSRFAYPTPDSNRVQRQHQASGPSSVPEQLDEADVHIITDHNTSDNDSDHDHDRFSPSHLNANKQSMAASAARVLGRGASFNVDFDFASASTSVSNRHGETSGASSSMDLDPSALPEQVKDQGLEVEVDKEEEQEAEAKADHPAPITDSQFIVPSSQTQYLIPFRLSPSPPPHRLLPPLHDARGAGMDMGDVVLSSQFGEMEIDPGYMESLPTNSIPPHPFTVGQPANSSTSAAIPTRVPHAQTTPLAQRVRFSSPITPAHVSERESSLTTLPDSDDEYQHEDGNGDGDGDAGGDVEEEIYPVERASSVTEPESDEEVEVEGREEVRSRAVTGGVVGRAGANNLNLVPRASSVTEPESDEEGKQELQGENKGEKASLLLASVPNPTSTPNLMANTTTSSASTTTPSQNSKSGIELSIWIPRIQQLALSNAFENVPPNPRVEAFPTQSSFTELETQWSELSYGYLAPLSQDSESGPEGQSKAEASSEQIAQRIEGEGEGEVEVGATSQLIAIPESPPVNPFNTQNTINEPNWSQDDNSQFALMQLSPLSSAAELPLPPTSSPGRGAGSVVSVVNVDDLDVGLPRMRGRGSLETVPDSLDGEVLRSSWMSLSPRTTSGIVVPIPPSRSVIVPPVPAFHSSTSHLSEREPNDHLPNNSDDSQQSEFSQGVQFLGEVFLPATNLSPIRPSLANSEPHPHYRSVLSLPEGVVSISSQEVTFISQDGSRREGDESSGTSPLSEVYRGSDLLGSRRSSGSGPLFLVEPRPPSPPPSSAASLSSRPISPVNVHALELESESADRAGVSAQANETQSSVTQTDSQYSNMMAEVLTDIPGPSTVTPSTVAPEDAFQLQGGWNGTQSSVTRTDSQYSNMMAMFFADVPGPSTTTPLINVNPPLAQNDTSQPHGDLNQSQYSVTQADSQHSNMAIPPSAQGPSTTEPSYSYSQSSPPLNASDHTPEEGLSEAHGLTSSESQPPRSDNLTLSNFIIDSQDLSGSISSIDFSNVSESMLRRLHEEIARDGMPEPLRVILETDPHLDAGWTQSQS